MTTTPLIKPAPPRHPKPSGSPAPASRANPSSDASPQTGKLIAPRTSTDAAKASSAATKASAAATKEEAATAAAAAALNPMARLHKNASSSEFNTAMIHFYRGEVQRSNAWRNRLDTTTNWAVLTAGATLSFAFTSVQNPHFVIIINSLLVAFFLFMEARRYRYYEIWSSRVRLLETGYLAGMLKPEAEKDLAWTARLAEDLDTPHFTISEWEAVGRRLRRNYLWIFILLAASWNLKVYLHPVPAQDFHEFIARASVGLLPGSFVFGTGVVFNAVMLIFAVATIRLREATGEVLPDHEFNLDRIRQAAPWSQEQRERRATNRRARRARTRVRRMVNLTGEWRKQVAVAFNKNLDAPPDTENDGNDEHRKAEEATDTREEVAVR